LTSAQAPKGRQESNEFGVAESAHLTDFFGVQVALWGDAPPFLPSARYLHPNRCTTPKMQGAQPWQPRPYLKNWLNTFGFTTITGR
jgi:hypothetical protein